MFKDFNNHLAWTDAMETECGFVGLIEYQSKQHGANINVLWVVAPDCICANEAEIAADNMLQQIEEITLEGKVIYSDGIAL